MRGIAIPTGSAGQMRGFEGGKGLGFGNQVSPLIIERHYDISVFPFEMVDVK